MKKILLSFSLLAFIACGSQKTASESHEQTNSPETEKQEIKKSPLLAEGNMTLEEVKAQTWYARSYDSYSPDEMVVNQLSEILKNHNYNIDVYFGTWCGDSRREVPKLVKLLEQTGFDFSHLTFVSVNRSKQVPNVTPEIAQQLNVHRVPTIIFYENGTETERFVERPRENLEKDILKIASGEVYLDSYE